MEQVYTSTNKLVKENPCDVLYIFVDKDNVRKSSIDSYYIVPSLVYVMVNGNRIRHEMNQLLNVKDSWVDIMKNDEWRYWVLVVDGSVAKQFTKDNITHDYYDVKLMRCKNSSVIEEIESITKIDDFTDFV